MLGESHSFWAVFAWRRPSLICEAIFHSTWSVCDENRVGDWQCANFFNCVEILSHQNHVHDILRHSSRYIHRQSKHTVPQPNYNGLKLACLPSPARYLDSAVHHMEKFNDRLISIQGKRSLTYPQRESRKNVQFKMTLTGIYLAHSPLHIFIRFSVHNERLTILKSRADIKNSKILKRNRFTL